MSTQQLFDFVTVLVVMSHPVIMVDLIRKHKSVLPDLKLVGKEGYTIAFFLIFSILWGYLGTTLNEFTRVIWMTPWIVILAGERILSGDPKHTPKMNVLIMVGIVPMAFAVWALLMIINFGWDWLGWLAFIITIIAWFRLGILYQITSAELQKHIAPWNMLKLRFLAAAETAIGLTCWSWWFATDSVRYAIPALEKAGSLADQLSVMLPIVTFGLITLAAFGLTFLQIRQLRTKAAAIAKLKRAE